MAAAEEVCLISTEDEGKGSGYDTMIEKDIGDNNDVGFLPRGANRRREKWAEHSRGHIVTNSGQHRRHISFAESVTEITLSWNKISAYAPLLGTGVCGRSYETGEQKQILRGVSGVVKPATLLAIMGASGAGKSTLLNVLTYRNKGNLVVSGDVRVNGQPVGPGIKALSAYVQQDDMFIGMLKVREHLWFQSQLRMDSFITQIEREERIEEVLVDMGLKKCADTYIGIPGKLKGISGGEMKRLSFASEVITNPPLMFCDEPTSGLDSYMAEGVIKTLKDMAGQGKTILCTIHQPSSEVYSLFDRLLLMAEGKVAYLGPAKNALGFFDSCGYPCPRNYNPADHFVHTLAMRPTQLVECQRRVDHITSRYFDTADYAELSLALQELDRTQDTELLRTTEDLQNRSPYKAGWFRQMHALLWRSWISQARDANVFAVRILQTLIVALIIALVYLQQPYNQKGLQNINGALFLFLTNTTFSNFFTVLNAFPLMLPIFYREHHNGMYRVDTYFICKNLAEVPIFILLPTLFIIVDYWLVGLYPDITNFFVALLTVILVTKAAVSFGYLISTSCGRIDLCLAVASPVLMPLMLFGGFFLNQGSIPQWLVWLQYLSWFRYGNEVLVVNQWSHVNNITCEYLQHNQTASSRCLQTGNDVISMFAFDSSSTLFNLIMLVVLTFVFRFFAFVALWLRAREKH